MKIFYSFIVITLLLVNVFSTSTETALSHGKVVVCYWETWSMHRRDRGNFQLENFDPTLCTHLILTFTLLDDADYSIKPLGNWLFLKVDENNKNNITKLKIKYPHLKVLASVGGWQDGSIKYSRMVENPEKRSSFANNTVEFLTQNDFDGLDIFWMFPTKRGGSLSDKENFLKLTKELRSKFDEYNLLLTAGLGASKDTIDNGYDMAGLSLYLDLMIVLSYDYHGDWSRFIAANAPLRSTDFLNVEYTIKHMLKLGADPKKLILGMCLYGRNFIMEEPRNTTAGPPQFGGNFKKETFFGNYTGDPSIGYNEICLLLSDKNLGWTSYWDWDSKTPYAVNGDKIISYDNDRSLIEKTRFAMQHGLGGVMAWSIDRDDFYGDCEEFVDGRKEFPLIRTINKELYDYTMNEVTETLQENLQALQAADDGLILKLDYMLMSLIVVGWILKSL